MSEDRRTLRAPLAAGVWAIVAAALNGCIAVATIYGDVDADQDGWTTDGGDCDDSNPEVHPQADERCDGVDSDCNGVVDDDYATNAPRWYADKDGDGFGGAGTARRACEAAPGWVGVYGDCNDMDPSMYPGAPELCDGLDNDCDWSVPPDETKDVDSDGFVACAECDDSDPLTYPGAPEQCDGKDNDCDNVVPTKETDDLDQDGFPVCADCDDEDASTYPGAREECGDGVVNDCDGTVEEAVAECELVGDVDLSRANAKYAGEDAGDEAGSSVAGVGDINSDGFDDYLVGAPGNWSFGAYYGAAYLAFGSASPSGEVCLSAADVMLTSAYWVGDIVVSGVGDFNGDGFDDLLVGAPSTDADSGGGGPGMAFVALGSGSMSGTIDLWEEAAVVVGTNSWAGFAVSGAGDVNGDGYDDVVLGEAVGGVELPPGTQTGEWYEPAGVAYLLLGSEESVDSVELPDADVVMLGESEDSRAGFAVSGAGDVSGDGLDDLLVGAPREDTGGAKAGAAYVVFGSAALEGEVELSDAEIKLTGETSGDGAGYSVAGAGDVDGDGYSDILVGAPYEDTGGTDAGATYLVLGSSAISGTTGLADADAKLVGEASRDESGTEVADAGDVDADGNEDILLGAPLADSGGSEAGITYLIFGSPGLVGEVDLSDANWRIIGEATGDRAGSSVSGAGDVDADGYDDLLVGAPREDSNGVDAGAAYLLLGRGGY